MNWPASFQSKLQIPLNGCGRGLKRDGLLRGSISKPTEGPQIRAAHVGGRLGATRHNEVSAATSPPHLP